MKEYTRFCVRALHGFGTFWRHLRVLLPGLVIAVCALNVAHAQDPQALLQQYRCYICHADTDTLTGPAYVDVAAKYKDKTRSRSVAAVAALIRKGVRGGGPWHMPPHPEVSDAEAKVMARYILSLRNDPL
jgi:cytochrome c